MTVTLRPSMPLSAWLPLQSAAGAFREESSSLELLVQELFADLERLGGELAAKADEVEEGRRHLAERGRQLAEQRKDAARLSQQLEQQETQLREALTELREIRGELAHQPKSVPSAEFKAENEQLRHQVTELQVERAILLERLKTALSQVQEGESAAPGFSQEAMASLTEQFAEQLSALHERIESLQEAPPAVAELDSLKEDRLELEAELELVRARSADLQKTVTRQKRELAAQQAEVNAELKELRALMAEQGERFAQQVAMPPQPVGPQEPARIEMQSSAPAPGFVAAAEQTPAKPADPVVNSVMAQFTKLQRDISQRRKKK